MWLKTWFQSNMKEILSLFSTLRWLPLKGGSKFCLQSTIMCKRDFDMIFHFKATQNLVAEHYGREFDMIFHFKAIQNLVAKHYERNFVMNFHFKVTQNMVADHYERDFDRNFYFKAVQNFVAEQYNV